MALRERLNHVAAGIAASFISRNNDLTGYWAPGLMYLELPDSPHHTVLDLLAERSSRGGPDCEQVARNLAAYMRLALDKKQLAAAALTHATLEVRFATAWRDTDLRQYLTGEPFEVAVILRAHGREGSSLRRSHCQPFETGRFNCRPGGVVR